MSDELTIKPARFGVSAFNALGTVTLLDKVVTVASAKFAVNEEITQATLASAFPDNDLSEVIATFNSEEAKQRLAARGIVYDDVLTPEMEAIAIIVSDTTGHLPLNKRLDLAGISGYQFQNLMRNKAFKQRINRAVEGMTANSDIALMALNEQVLKGNMRAIELSLAISGRYNPKAEAQITMNTVMAEMLDVITQNVSDPKALTAISQRFRGIGERLNNTHTTMIEG